MKWCWSWPIPSNIKVSVKKVRDWLTRYSLQFLMSHSISGNLVNCLLTIKPKWIRRPLSFEHQRVPSCHPRRISKCHWWLDRRDPSSPVWIFIIWHVSYFDWKSASASIRSCDFVILARSGSCQNCQQIKANYNMTNKRRSHLLYDCFTDGGDSLARSMNELSLRPVGCLLSLSLAQRTNDFSDATFNFASLFVDIIQRWVVGRFLLNENKTRRFS